MTGLPHTATHIKRENPTAVTNKFTSLEYDNLNRLREITHSSQTDKYWYNSVGNSMLFQEKYTGSTIAESRFNLVIGDQTMGHYREVPPIDKVGGSQGKDYSCWNTVLFSSLKDRRLERVLSWILSMK